MDLPIVNHPDYVAKINDDNKFPIKKFGEIANHLKENFIETRYCYPPLSLQEYLIDSEHEDLQHSEDIAQRTLWLPSSTKLGEKELEKISNTLKSFYK